MEVLFKEATFQVVSKRASVAQSERTNIECLQGEPPFVLQTQRGPGKRKDECDQSLFPPAGKEVTGCDPKTTG